jgi:hypothetical protein
MQTYQRQVRLKWLTVFETTSRKIHQLLPPLIRIGSVLIPLSPLLQNLRIYIEADTHHLESRQKLPCLSPDPLRSSSKSVRTQIFDTQPT